MKYQIDGTLKAPLGRHDAEAPNEWLRDDKLVIHDFQRQRR